MNDFDVFTEYYNDNEIKVPYNEWLELRRDALINLADFYKGLRKKCLSSVKVIDKELKRIGEK